ncbi:hypothetical protein ADICYQ_5556 [Cyclobacterium qasimii M12-11B]|uniref:Uncharacterized protein n=1 Tax=Cyclobacterium qasimii M12-11B TaxID=641524 RepID=S7V6X7_9BACT|nr:hypothetical protein ADICYQ_5556 [Cyclobacterium qasimii M12-11B]
MKVGKSPMHNQDQIYNYRRPKGSEQHQPLVKPTAYIQT